MDDDDDDDRIIRGRTSRGRAAALKSMTYGDICRAREETRPLALEATVVVTTSSTPRSRGYCTSQVTFWQLSFVFEASCIHAHEFV